MQAFFANAWHLFESVLDGIKPSLSARLILVGGAATRESNDSGN